jgi:hypothetical protein
MGPSSSLNCSEDTVSQVTLMLDELIFLAEPRDENNETIYEIPSPLNNLETSNNPTEPTYAIMNPIRNISVPKSINLPNDDDSIIDSEAIPNEFLQKNIINPLTNDSDLQTPPRINHLRPWNDVINRLHQVSNDSSNLEILNPEATSTNTSPHEE